MGISFCFNGRRTKKLIGSPQFNAQFAVANSQGYRLFKTECVEDMPFEQFRVLMAAMQKFNKEFADTATDGISNGMSGEKKERTTYRIINEE